MLRDEPGGTLAHAVNCAVLPGVWDFAHFELALMCHPSHGNIGHTVIFFRITFEQGPFGIFVFV
jgi:hypothetical protein